MSFYNAHNLFSDEHSRDCIICRYNCTFPDPTDIDPSKLLPSMLEQAQLSGVPMLPPEPAEMLPGEVDPDEILIGTAEEVDNRLAGR